jgi:hypothetical protein
MRKGKKQDGLRVRGFLRGQIVDRKTGRIVSDSGWRKNVVTDYGLTALANYLTATGNPIGYAVMAEQSAAVDVTQVDLGSTFNSYAAIASDGYSTLGTCTAQFTGSFAGTNHSATDMTASLNALGLHISNAGSDLFAGQTFDASNMTTAQDFKFTYQIRFATSA